ncbi:acyl carrier protein [Streptomyces sp. NPDC051207]|uniref:acyl carrier protein n=1 Tax=Streptomyces sp. NPDC051207 TaxID=3154641 RepID=UPI00343CB51F
MTTATYDMLVTKLSGDLGVDETLIRPDATFAQLEVDSLAVLELGVILEEDFRITFDLEEFKREDMTLEQFAGHVQALLDARPSAAAGAV